MIGPTSVSRINDAPDAHVKKPYPQILPVQHQLMNTSQLRQGGFLTRQRVSDTAHFIRATTI